MPRLGRRPLTGLLTIVVSVCLLATLIQSVAADCECGYSTDIDGEVHVLTDLIETDFAHLADIATNTDWVRQAFNVTSDADRGSYGEMYATSNMQTVVAPKNDLDSGRAEDGQPAGLRLLVKSGLVGDMVPVSEIDSSRTDIMYGSFRAGIRLTNVTGTCSAFFWYYNDTQEIDMEFLSREYNASNRSYPVNLVLQSRAAAESGFNAQGTPTFVKARLPFDPTADFYEYRIDFLPGRVYFYAGGQLLAKMAGDAVPTHAGHLVLQQWSNGNPLWSGGPPDQDAVSTVSYVKAYFNSSSPQRQKDWTDRCRSPGAPGAVCAIPSVTATNTTASGWFFTDQKNMTNNQTVSGHKSGGEKTLSAATALWTVSVVAFMAFGWEFGVW
ncbi:hypothetical protein SEPCBS119000_003476 [Sporothrix epigloea]|uniref:GH16 domain-containing protein n=1 Tax=Sporothrix epigloea TaxID=1892477 RepID=A0ABP0DLW9_9PEZI